MRTLLKYSSFTVVFSTLLMMIVISSCKKGEFGDDQQDSFVKFYGSSYYDQAFEIKEVSDGYVMVGNTTALETGELSNHTEISIRKINKFGNLMWERSYGNIQGVESELRGEDEGRDFIIAQDGGFVITGYMTRFDSNGIANPKVCLLKTDPSGIEMWRKFEYEFLIDTILNSSEGYSILEADGNYIIGGKIINSLNALNNPSDNLVFRTSPDGQQLDRPQDGLNETEFADEIVDIVPNSDGNPLLIGTTSSKLDQTPTVFMGKAILSSFGIPDLLYGNDVSNEIENGVTAINEDDETTVLVNRTRGGTNYVSLEQFTNANSLSPSLGNVMELDPDGTGIEMVGSDMFMCSDGCYIVTGYVTSESQERDVFLAKVSPNFSQLWIKSFGSTTLNEQGESLIETEDGGYLILASSGFNGTRVGNTSVMIIKTLSDGTLK